MVAAFASTGSSPSRRAARCQERPARVWPSVSRRPRHRPSLTVPPPRWQTSKRGAGTASRQDDQLIAMPWGADPTRIGVPGAWRRVRKCRVMCRAPPMIWRLADVIAANRCLVSATGVSPRFREIMGPTPTSKRFVATTTVRRAGMHVDRGARRGAARSRSRRAPVSPLRLLLSDAFRGFPARERPVTW
jgi:hypothetical protein